MNFVVFFYSNYDPLGFLWPVNFNDAGESRLPGVSVMIDIPAGRVYEVLRSRCRARLSYGNPTPGLMKILDTETGREVYVKREYMEAV